MGRASVCLLQKGRLDRSVHSFDINYDFEASTLNLKCQPEFKSSLANSWLCHLEQVPFLILWFLTYLWSSPKKKKKAMKFHKNIIISKQL